MIRIESLTKRYRTVIAVDGLSFEVEPGRIVAFLGPNGAGKSTTLRILLGLAAPTSGRATVNDRSYADLGSPAETVGAVLDRPQFHPDRSGRDHLRILAAASGLSPKRVEEVLDLVELSDAGQRRVLGYSLGMRQRLSIAAALLGRPRALILDEPTNGLDPRGLRWLHDLLRTERDRGAAILLSSHHIPGIQPLADDAVIIDRGREVAHGPISTLTAGSTTAVHVLCSEPGLLRDRLTQSGIDADLTSSGAVVARRVAATRVGEIALGDGIAIHRMDAHERTLEDVFLELTSSGSPP